MWTATATIGLAHRLSREKQDISKDDRERLKELHIMKMKFLGYPIVTIIIWILSAIYRAIDDLFIASADRDDERSDESEKQKFQDKPALQNFIETILLGLIITFNSYS